MDFYQNKKVFITGHTGFKGTWLTRILLIAGAQVTGYALNPPTDPAIFELTATETKMNSIIGDVTDTAKLVQAIKDTSPEIVFHLAAQPLVRYSYKYPVETYRTNVLGTVNIMEAVRLCSSVKSFVNVTTDKVYENQERSWGYREDENLCGFDPYSNSKSCSELVTSGYRNSFFNQKDSAAISSARSGNVIGGGDYAQDRIIPDCLRAVKNKQPIILRNPNSIRPYQHVLECLHGYLLLAKLQFDDKNLQGAYNFGPDDQSCVTTGQLAEIFCRFWGDGVKWEAKNDNGPHEANFLKLDNTKAKTLLHWQPRWTIEQSVEKVVDWQKAVDNGSSPAEITDWQIKQYFKEQ